MKAPCDISCRQKCSLRIEDTTRQEIHNEFWKTPNKCAKWNYIARHVKSQRIEKSKRKEFSFKYHFTVQGIDIPVCKTMFLETLDICDGWIRTSIRKVQEKGIVSPDRRGKNSKRPMPIDLKIKESVRNHIEIIPRMPSHYCRSTSSKEYLTEEIQSVSKMYDLYKEWMLESFSNQPIATVRQYRDIFNSEYNISFFVAKKDQCDDCFTYKNANEEEKVILQDEHDRH